MARTTHRSRSGTKLYAKRNRKGEFTDIQTYKRAHGSDVKRKSAAEGRKATRKTGTKKTGAKKTAKKKTATKVRRKSAKKK